MFVLDHNIRSGQCQSTLIMLCYEIVMDFMIISVSQFASVSSPRRIVQNRFQYVFSGESWNARFSAPCS